MPNPLLSLASFVARVLPLKARQALYRNPWLAGLIRKGLNRAAPAGITPVTVAAGPLAGMRLALDMHSEKDYWLGTYEPELMAALQESLEPGAVAYDIGANIGYITILLAGAVGGTGKVIAFEAHPVNVERLRMNLELNALTSRVQVIAGAVIDASEEVQFLVGPSGGMGKAAGSAGRRDLEYQESITVPGYSLDEFVFHSGNPAPQVVKMDIEGGEVMALPGMRRVLREARPIVYLELHGPEAAQAAWRELIANGYRICRVLPGIPVVPSISALDWKAYLVAFPLDG